MIRKLSQFGRFSKMISRKFELESVHTHAHTLFTDSHHYMNGWAYTTLRLKNVENRKCRKSTMSKIESVEHRKCRKSKILEIEKVENRKCRKSKMSKTANVENRTC